MERFFAHYEPKLIQGKREYAVLIPIIMVNDFPHILYEVRSKNISQPGDTSFPGGKVEPGETFQEAAVRETVEELQIPKEAIKVIGEMDFIVRNNVIIRSFVGEIKGIEVQDIVWNEEVAEIYTVPVRYFMENKPDVYSVNISMDYPDDFPFNRIPNGKNYPFYTPTSAIPFYNLEDHYLWGFTASLTERLVNIMSEHHLLEKLNNPKKNPPY